jgi:predicted glycoside hydrolase/deacetylase ChbG (UPF0249 family)
MANAAAFEDAVEISRRCPSLSVGCHIVLVDGMPVLRAAEVSSLLDHGSGFRDSLEAFFAVVLSGRAVEEQIEAEAVAQIRKLQAAGIRVSHLDTHKHTHVLPRVLRAVLSAAKACGVQAIRNPFECPSLHMLRGNPALCKRWLEVRALRIFEHTFQREVKSAGIATTSGATGVAVTGVLTPKLFRESLESLPEGTWEFVCHPGYEDDDLARARTRLRASREQEQKILTDPASRAWLEAAGFELASYREL